MTLFENRERGFEQMFAHDEETRFKALARRNKLIGLWAAERLGLTGEKADAYVTEIRQDVLAAHGDDAIIAKIRADFEANGIAVDENQIRGQMGDLLTTAIAQIRADIR